MKSFRFPAPFILFLLFSLNTWGQDVEMADQWRADGKIRIVIGVVLIILFGLFIYLIRIDRRLRTLERKDKS